MLGMEKTLGRAINFSPPACWDLLLGQVLGGDRFVGPWRPTPPPHSLPGGMLSQIRWQRAELSRSNRVRSELEEHGRGNCVLPKLTGVVFTSAFYHAGWLVASFQMWLSSFLIGPNENYTCKGKGITCIPPPSLVLFQITIGKKGVSYIYISSASLLRSSWPSAPDCV